MTLTEAEVRHLVEALFEFQYWINQYPETVDDRTEESLAVAMEILQV